MSILNEVEDETVEQIRSAPAGAYYVCANRDSLGVARRIAMHLDRADLRFLVLSDLRRPGAESGRFFLRKAFVIDHAARPGMSLAHRKVVEMYAEGS